MPFCLEHMKGAVDEIVIVDTGSKDGTLEIAKQAGVKVYQVPWKNDFSAAKNYAIERATGKWILFLDADERISEDDTQRIKPLLDNPMAEGYLFYIYTKMEWAESSSPTQSLRLFRNRKEYRYQNRVSERIPDDAITSIKDAGIVILHQPDPQRFRQIQQLKRNLLEQEIREQPEDSYLRYVYGIELLNERKYDQAAEQFSEAIETVSTAHVYAPHLYKCLAWSLMSQKRIKEAIGSISRGLNPFPFYTDLLFLRGQCHKELRQYKEAIKDLESCLRMGDPPNSLMPEPGVGTFKALLSLGEIHQELLNHDKALEFYKKSFLLEQTYTEPLYRMGTLITENARLGEGDQVILGLIDPSDPEQMMTLIDVLCMERRYSQALMYAKRVESAIGTRDDISFVKGICYSMQGQPDEAEQQFLKIKTDSPYYHQVLLHRIQNFWLHDRWNEAGKMLQEMALSPQLSPSAKSVYSCTHAWLTGQLLEDGVSLNPEGNETLAKFIENFLWINQTPKAKVLLEWLLKSESEHLYMKIGEMLAEQNDGETVERIFCHMKDPLHRVNYREKTAKRFMQNENVEWAEKMLKTDQETELGVTGYLVRNKILLHRTVEILSAGMRSRKVDKETKNKLFTLMECMTDEN